MDFKTVCRNIKEVKIQGAENIALAGVKALKLKGANKDILLKLRPTEPLLKNALKTTELFGEKFVLSHFDNSRKKIAEIGFKIIKGRVFTHCHSTSVINVLKKAKQKGKKFEVYNTETRPLFQGRRTAIELSKLKIPSTMIIDAAAGEVLEGRGKMKKADVMIIGADAILSNGDIVNKIGSNMFAEIADKNKIPVYIVANSWKYSPNAVKIEERNNREVWKQHSNLLKIENPAFEVVSKKYITGIISELGIFSPEEFIRKVRDKYPWIN